MAKHFVDSEKLVSRNRQQLRSILIIIFGALCAAGSGYLTYHVLNTAETNEFEKDYELLTEGIAAEAGVALSRTQQVCEHHASIISAMFPDAEQWPLVSLPRYSSSMQPLIDLLSAANIYHAPIVTEEHVDAFEEYAKNYYATDPDTSGLEGMGYSDFGFGIFALDENGERFHNNKTDVPWETKYNFLTPVFIFGDVASKYTSALVNGRYEASRGVAQEHVADCFNEKVSNGEKGNSCAAMTDFTILILQTVAPASIFFYPEYPANNASLLTGFIGVVFNWDVILAGLIPRAQNKDYKLYLELHSPTTSATFLADNSEVHYVSGKFKKRFQQYRRNANIDSAVGMSPYSAQFSVSVYPHEDMVAEYYSDQPEIWAVVVGVCAFVFFMFIFYIDYFVAASSYEAEITSSLRKLFLRYISHEIRSPLNAVYMGLTDILLKDHAGDERASQDALCSEISGGQGVPAAAQELHDIKRNVEGAIVVLDDLVTYAALADGSKGISYRSAPVICTRQLVHEVLNATGDLFSNSSELRVADENSDEHPTIRANSSDLRLAVTYMLKLAVKMAPTNDPIELRAAVNSSPVWLRNIPTTMRTVSIAIKYLDVVPFNEDRKKMPFEDATHKWSQGGAMDTLRAHDAWSFAMSSLGHWIVHRITTIYHGCVEMYHTPCVDDPTTFWTTIEFEFPLVKSELCRDCRDNRRCSDVSLDKSLRSTLPAQSPPEIYSTIDLTGAIAGDEICAEGSTYHRVESTEITRGRNNSSADEAQTEKLKLTLLVVDDVESNRKILSRLLTKMGHECILACDGAEAVEKASDGTVFFDAICMDYEMPIMNGPTAAKTLRDMHCEIPIIGVTGNVLPEDIEYFKTMGAQEVICKPVNIGLLQNLLKKHVLGSSSTTLRRECKTENEIVAACKPGDACIL